MQLGKIQFLLSALFVFALAFAAQAQQDKSKRPSPHVTASDNIGDTKIVIYYGSPSVKGRKVWGNLVPYEKIWRTGANEASTLDVSTDVLIEGQELPAGRYAIFTIPGEEEWTIIFNKEADQWGAYGYKEAQDALRIDVKAGKPAEFAERLQFSIATKGAEAASVTLAWENVAVGFGIAPAK